MSVSYTHLDVYKRQTLDISPKGQVVASTASTAGDINQGNSVVVKEIPQEDLNITGTAHVTLTLPDDFASKTIYIKHQASNGRTYFYTAEADEGANQMCIRDRTIRISFSLSRVA